MSCEDNCCGTGSHSGSFPVPGDPDLNNSVLSAVSMLHGIRVKWTYPLTLDHAVAYTNVFRSSSSDQATANKIEQVSATFYDDLIDETDNSTYYYWITFVSVNGTEGDLIGPVSANRQPTAARMLELLEGQITDSALAQALRDPIAQVPSIASDLSDEISNRVTEIASYNIAIQQAINDSSDAYNYADSVNTAYQTAISASQSRLDSFITGSGAEYTAFEEMIALNIDAGLDGATVQGMIDTTLSSERQNLFGTTDNVAINDRWDTLLTATEVNAAIDTVLVSERQAMFGTSDRAAINSRWDTLLTDTEVNAAIDTKLLTERQNTFGGTDLAAISSRWNNLITDSEATASINTSLAAERTSLFGTSNASTINSKWDTLQSDSQVSSSINTALSSERTSLFGTTNVATINSRWDTLITQDEASAQFTTVLDVNGVLGGYGIHNDGVEVTTLFDVDKFLIGRTDGSLIDLAFAVDNGKVVMDGTHIQDATINNAAINALDVNKVTGLTAVLDALEVEFARITGNIQSDNFVSGSAGWNVDRNGSAEFNDITIYDGNGNVALQSGQTYLVKGSDLQERTNLNFNAHAKIKDDSVSPPIPQGIESARVTTSPNSYIAYVDTAQTSLRLYADDTSGTYSVISWPAFPLASGRKYKIRCRYFASTGNTTGNVRMLTYNSDLSSSKTHVKWEADSTGVQFDSTAASTHQLALGSWQSVEFVVTPDPGSKWGSMAVVLDDFVNIDYIEVYEELGDVANLDTVTTTYISDAAITEAKIALAQIGTLLIKENAVTVPAAVEADGPASGNYTLTPISFTYNTDFTDTIKCLVQCHVTISNGGNDYCWVNLQVDGVEVARADNLGQSAFAALSAIVDMAPGDHTIRMQLRSRTNSGSDDSTTWQDALINVMGIKR